MKASEDPAGIVASRAEARNEKEARLRDAHASHVPGLTLTYVNSIIDVFPHDNQFPTVIDAVCATHHRQTGRLRWHTTVCWTAGFYGVVHPDYPWFAASLEKQLRMRGLDIDPADFDAQWEVVCRMRQAAIESKTLQIETSLFGRPSAATRG